MHGHWQRKNKRGNVGADLCVRHLLERKYFMQRVDTWVDLYGKYN